MTAGEVPRALTEAFDTGHVEVTQHFWDELRADAFFHTDVQCAVESVASVVDRGFDQVGNPKFEVTGTAADGRLLSLVCSFKPTGAVLLLTVYEGK